MEANCARTRNNVMPIGSIAYLAELSDHVFEDVRRSIMEERF